MHNIGNIPTEVSALVRLRHFDVSFNKLNGVLPASIGKLRSLKYLHVGNNLLSGAIPKEISRCINLEYLNLEETEVTFPGATGDYSDLLFMFCCNLFFALRT